MTKQKHALPEEVKISIMITIGRAWRVIRPILAPRYIGFVGSLGITYLSEPRDRSLFGTFLFDIDVNLAHLMDSINVSELVERLGSDEDAVRKMAVFKLQSNIGDPSFADVFILEGGLTKLRYLALHATGNTLAYSLTSFSRLLEVDKGWEYVNSDLVERVKLFSRAIRRLLIM